MLLDTLNYNSKRVALDCVGLLGGSKSVAQGSLDVLLYRGTKGKVIVRVDYSKKINDGCHAD